MVGLCGWFAAQAVISGHQAQVQTQRVGSLAQSLEDLQDTGAQDARRAHQQDLHDRAVWHQAFLAREEALGHWRTELARRIANDYNLAPQAAQFLVKESQQAAEQQQVDPVLLLAIVGAESRFNPYVISSGGAIGLTQTMPSAHPDQIKVVNEKGSTLVDPSSNLNVGAAILSEYLQRARGNKVAALQQYNGASNDKTAKYARKVLHIYDRLHAQLPALPQGPSTPYPTRDMMALVAMAHAPNG